jgi:hypothetical protein
MYGGNFHNFFIDIFSDKKSNSDFKIETYREMLFFCSDYYLLIFEYVIENKKYIINTDNIL